MLWEPMGQIIDTYDKVIRLKRCQDTLKHPDYYGTKTDVIGGSLTIAGQLRGIGNAPEYWVFVDSRHTKFDPVELARVPQMFGNQRCILDKALCDDWDQRYRDKRDQMGGHGHNHTSQGFKAIVYALQHMTLDSLTLVGFDNVLTGEFTWSITRGPDWKKYPDHRWR